MPPCVPLPSTLVILRREQRKDFESVERLYRLAFGQHDEAEMVPRLRASEAFIAGLSIVAEEEGSIGGHILFTRVYLDPPSDSRVISLAPMAVLPHLQRRGIGSALVRNGLDAAGMLGEDVAVVVGHPEYYPRFGFEPAARFGMTCPFPAPDEAFLALSLRAGARIPASDVVYPPEARGWLAFGSGRDTGP
jgi:putative acetyltransferase